MTAAVFSLTVLDLSQRQRYETVTRFVGRDASGSFAIDAHHTLFITCLLPGLARFCDSDGQWRYLAQAGATLVFQDNGLTLVTQQSLISSDRAACLPLLEQGWRQQAADRAAAHRQRTQLDHSLARKLQALHSGEEPA